MTTSQLKLPALLAVAVIWIIYLVWPLPQGGKDQPEPKSTLEPGPTPTRLAWTIELPQQKRLAALSVQATVTPVAALAAALPRQAVGDSISAGLYHQMQREINASQKQAERLAQQLIQPVESKVLATPAVIAVVAVPVEVAAPASSVNSYALIPLEGARESRPAEAHGDLNLKLRDPQPISVDLNLVEINGSGLDPDAPNLASVFKPDFVQAYTVHDWDWGCDCKGQLLRDEHSVLLGIRTTPGQPVFIPSRGQNVYRGSYYATLLYASEDTLTFVYTRAGNVARGYTVHYLGLQTDPNLLALFRQSQGSQLPGLTLHTPVGIATGELIVAVRDNGTFLDVRSRHDWWE
ncbi:MAG: hypothetical protein HC875_28995 [Anaerolineales bacterium]|nr:hypothetical protein [Anaerolineales bacterium]